MTRQGVNWGSTKPQPKQGQRTASPRHGGTQNKLWGQKVKVGNTRPSEKITVEGKRGSSGGRKKHKSVINMDQNLPRPREGSTGMQAGENNEARVRETAQD